jgi:hypothetical protein
MCAVARYRPIARVVVGGLELRARSGPLLAQLLLLFASWWRVCHLLLFLLWRVRRVDASSLRVRRGVDSFFVGLALVFKSKREQRRCCADTTVVYSRYRVLGFC